MKNLLRKLWHQIPDSSQRKIRKIMRMEKIKLHPNAASNGYEMIKWIEKIKRLASIKIENMIEIGANYGQDAEFARYYLGIPAKNIFVFEPHPQLISEIRKYYQYNAFNYAISNKDGKATFHAIDLNKHNNSGISSFLQNSNVDPDNFFDVEVETMRMDTFINQNSLNAVDFVKMDVEGFTFEVLEGFGDKLKIVKSIQLEAEHQELFKGEQTFDQVANLLKKYQFEMVYFEMLDTVQSDSLWIKREFLRTASLT